MTRLRSRLPLLLAGLLICVQAQAGSPAKVHEYHLTIAEQSVNITGSDLPRITVNGQFPAPALEFEEGEEAVIHVHNNLNNQDTSVHWHGLLLPGYMDGVPGFNGFPGIPPGTHFEYRFTLRQHGTYWYHAHSRSQEQDGLYGAFIVHPAGKQPIATHERSEQDYVIMLSDFHELHGEQIMRNLKKSAEYYQDQRETMVDVWRQIQHNGLLTTLRERAEWNQMRMLRTDLADVTGYTFLVNGQPATRPWQGEFHPGETLRLRFINASAMSFFDVRIPGLDMIVVSADGQPVKPVTVQEFRIGTAETYDVLVRPRHGRYVLEAESIDRSGFALALLSNGKEPAAPITEPKARPRALLTMADMGHGEHSGHDMATMNHAAHSGHNHDKHAHHRMAAKQDEHAGHHPHHGHGLPEEPTPEAAAAPHNMTVSGWADAATPDGHKMLQYRDLQSLLPQPDQRPPARDLIIHLGGSMERYIWTLNGKKFTEAKPWQLQFGERVRLTFVNNSMMAHPMHLHGMFMQLETGVDAALMPNKHTIIVPPGQTVSALLTANEPGEWAIHCHLLYHMSAGMMNKVVVAQVSDDVPAEHADHHHGHHQEPVTSAAVHTEHSHAHDREHGNQIFHSTLADLGLYQDEQRDNSWRGEIESRIGTDENRLFIKVHGHKETSHAANYKALLLYSRMHSEFWDIQLGIGYRDSELLQQEAAIIGVHGLAPGFIETDLHLWLHPDRQTITLEAERDLLLTQRWITQPYINTEYVLNSTRNGQRNGLTELRLGLETRYEINKRIRPFVDIAWTHEHESSNISAARHWQAGLGLTLLF
ncbi:MAG: copper resistance system multicopper oxidase [Bacterioplanes sp.]|nr:copper resistance system multicopper oxidase [Bacterioplanes sp.]